jgi:hypothetical protein
VRGRAAQVRRLRAEAPGQPALEWKPLSLFLSRRRFAALPLPCMVAPRRDRL